MDERDRPTIIIDVSRQLLVCHARAGYFRYPVSTARNGTGFEPGSFKTPTGLFRIAEKIGAGSPAFTIFRSRIPSGIWPCEMPDGISPDEDLVLTRILWLEGLEERNANSYDRYIYIHGTNHERDLGNPASCGCVRMANRDIIELFDLVDEGAIVRIDE